MLRINFSGGFSFRWELDSRCKFQNKDVQSFNHLFQTKLRLRVRKRRNEDVYNAIEP